MMSAKGSAARSSFWVITAERLEEEHGLTPRGIRRLYPHATEYTDNDGNPDWRTEELVDADKD